MKSNFYYILSPPPCQVEEHEHKILPKISQNLVETDTASVPSYQKSLRTGWRPRRPPSVPSFTKNLPEPGGVRDGLRPLLPKISQNLVESETVMSWTVMIKSYARVYSTDPSHPQQPTAGPPQESELPTTPANALGDHHSRSSSYPAAISFPQPKSQSTHSTSATPPRSFTSLPAFTTIHC